MGWGNCGKDSKGRDIGYCFDGSCDFPGCNKEIHRGLAYSCGGMHGEDQYSCEGYFCYDHLLVVEINDDSSRDGNCLSVCQDCYNILAENNLIDQEEKLEESYSEESNNGD